MRPQATPTITFTSLPYISVSRLDEKTRMVNEHYQEETWYSREDVFCDTLRGLVEVTEGDLGVRYNSHRSQIEVAILRDGELTVPSVEGYKAFLWIAQQVQDAQHILKSLQDPLRPPLEVRRVVLKAYEIGTFEWEVAFLGV